MSSFQTAFPDLHASVEDVAVTGDRVWVRSVRTGTHEKDRVTDVSWNYRIKQQIPPFTPPEDVRNPWTMYQVDVERLYEFRKCIECWLCQDVCHVLRQHELFGQYYGGH